MTWSDGRTRGEGFTGTTFQIAVQCYFESALEEERLRLKWENEQLRVMLERKKELSNGLETTQALTHDPCGFTLPNARTATTARAEAKYKLSGQIDKAVGVGVGA